MFSKAIMWRSSSIYWVQYSMESYQKLEPVGKWQFILCILKVWHDESNMKYLWYVVSHYRYHTDETLMTYTKYILHIVFIFLSITDFTSSFK